jgi:hypothetical protein
MWRPFLTAALIAGTAVLSGCGGDDSMKVTGIPADPLSGADAVNAKLKATFANEPAMQGPIDEVTKALKNHDLEGAAVGVQALQMQGGSSRTFEQGAVLNKLMQNVQGTIANGVASGDPAALKAVEAMKAASAHR